MTRPGTPAPGTVWAAAATVVAAGAVAALGLGVWGPAPTLPLWEAAIELVDLVPMVLGWLLVRAAPRSPVGPALVWTGAATLAVRAVTPWSRSAGTERPWPGAGVAVHLDTASWPWQLMGFLALLLVFPDGLLPGRRWRAVALLGPLAALAITVGIATSSTDPEVAPSGLRLTVLLAGMAGLLTALLAAVAGLAVRHHRGTVVVRRQLHLLLLAAGSVPVLLAAGWVLEGALDAPTGVAYAGFLIGMLVLVPAAVTVAVLQHDLLDVDRLVGATLAGVVTAVVSAGVFAVTVVLLGRSLSASAGLSAATAAFLTAVCLLPLHARVRGLVARVTDRERSVLLTAVHRFADQVRDGVAEPAQLEAVLGAVLGETVRLGIVPPGGAGLVDLRGRPFTVPPGAETISLRDRDAEVGVLALDRPTARRRRLAAEAATVARLPLEVGRLQLGLRASLAEVTASRSRLVEAVAAERHRLERDLHDGAQTHVVAVGMRLRSLQARLDGGSAVHAELDQAVAALEDTVAELRRVAHGIRPSRLDDGLAAALQALTRGSPVPLRLTVEDVAPADLDEAVETTAYFVVAEALANTWKHARAQRVEVRVSRAGGRTVVEVCDDGVGGVDPGRALTGLRDRVGSLGGRLEVVSPPGGGTRLTAVL